MPKNRLEAFTDCVFSIIITILVLQLTAPSEATFEALWSLRYSIVIYVLSFGSLAIYWVNHHHIFHLANKVNGKVLWLNMALLLFLSLFPFTTSWVDKHAFQPAPAIVFSVNVLLADIFYVQLVRELIRLHGEGSAVEQIFCASTSKKSKITISIVCCSIALGIWLPIVSVILCAASMLIWITPNRRIEQAFVGEEKRE